MTPPPLDLDALEAARKAAMPGEWTTKASEEWRDGWATVFCGKWTLLNVNLYIGGKGPDEIHKRYKFGSAEHNRGPELPAATSDFIALAANHWQALIDEVRRLRAENERLKEQPCVHELVKTWSEQTGESP